MKLKTVNGSVFGRFVGSIEYAVSGDPINGFETERMLAFASDDERLFGAIEDGPAWKLYSMQELGGILHRGEYPIGWEQE